MLPDVPASIRQATAQASSPNAKRQTVDFRVFAVGASLLAMAEAKQVVPSLDGWVFVVNPSSASGHTGGKWPKMLEKFKAAASAKGWRDIDRVQAVLTSAPSEATDLTRKALREGATVVVAVGGDGTLSEVVEGFFEPGSHSTVSPTGVLAFVPSGTGGDFRKSLQWSTSFPEICEHLLGGSVRKVDVGHVVSSGLSDRTRGTSGRHFINIASCGSSALIAQIANSSPNLLGSAITFYQASVRGLLQYQPRTLWIRVDGGDWQVVCVCVCDVLYGPAWTAATGSSCIQCACACAYLCVCVCVPS